LSLADHRDLGDQLCALRADSLEVRATVKGALGSATSAYMEATKVIRALERLQTALLLEATGEYADQASLAELRALYANGEGQ